MPFNNAAIDPIIMTGKIIMNEELIIFNVTLWANDSETFVKICFTFSLNFVIFDFLSHKVKFIFVDE